MADEQDPPGAAGSRRTVEGPYFEDLARGDVYSGSPALTLTAGHAAVHQAVTGDRLRLCHDHQLSRQVTGEAEPLLHPALVWDTAIGQSSEVTRNVVANLFYRGLAFRRFPHQGDTLHTRTEVVGLRQNRARPGRSPTGLALLRIRTVDQQQREVLDFRRCAMLPLRSPEAVTGHDDDLEAAAGIADGDGRGAASGWRLDGFRDVAGGAHFAEMRAGTAFDVAAGDVVSSAPELARLTLNIAAVHHDAGSSQPRLVYGGHTVALALAQATRAIPNLVTVLAWQGCDHLAPVREGDTLRSEVTVESVEGLPAGGGLMRLRSRVRARPPASPAETPVLDWRFTALMA
ncbi:MAG TPA: MaoC family dehydratase [Candidatus Dormibacteraeota bacterium]|nr:MaoC family dehydratase [Candidatus Dormibacteraeota bacterium]